MSPNIRTRTEGDGVAVAMPLTTFVGRRGEHLLQRDDLGLA
jgi:hypothetical protein